MNCRRAKGAVVYRSCLIVLSIVVLLTLPFVGLTEDKDTAAEPKEKTATELKQKSEETGKKDKKNEDVAEEIVEETATNDAENEPEVNSEEKTSLEASAEDAGTITEESKEIATIDLTENGAAGVDSPKGSVSVRSIEDNASTDETISEDAAETKSLPEVGEAQEGTPKTKSAPGKYNKMITAGVGVPLCGFAYNGIIEGKGCANTSSDFLWGNIDLRFQYRLSNKFAVGGGLLQSIVYFDGFGLLGGHLVADFIWYAVPDYLYFKMDLFFGFPMFFALGPSMGHSFSVNEKVHIFIENQFLFMAVAGVYGFWQPTVGVSTRF